MSTKLTQRIEPKLDSSPNGHVAQDRRVVFERHLSSSIEADVDAVNAVASRRLLLLMRETSGGEKETESVGLHVDEDVDGEERGKRERPSGSPLLSSLGGGGRAVLRKPVLPRDERRSKSAMQA